MNDTVDSSPSCAQESLWTESGIGSSWLRDENRLSHEAGLVHILEEGGELSPAFGIPWLTLSSLRLDWLHVADQGITPVFMGGLFSLILTKRQYGANEDERVAWIWGQIQEYYAREGTQDRLLNLTRSMIKPKTGSIELSGSGAQIRSLVPFCLQMVNTWEPPLDGEAYQARAAMRHLSTCYSYLSTAMEAQDMSLLDSAVAFHSVLRGLNAIDAKRWQLRPKLHLFMELCREPGPPSSSWNYREESYGGSVSRQSHHRGGVSTLLSMSRTCLAKFCSKEALPRLLP